MQSSIHHVLTVLVLTPLLPVGEAALAAHPDKPIRMVVISAPGGGGIISAEITARANPDGYTPLYTHTSYSALPGLHKKLPYDPVRDFAPVSLFAIFPGVLIVNNAVPVKFAEYIKAQIAKWAKVAGVAGARAD